MYGYDWKENEYGIYELSVNSKVEKEIRPVFKEELDFFEMYKYWQYPDTDAPLLWAEGIRRYILSGECVAEAKGGGFYTKPKIEVYKKDLVLHPVNITLLAGINNHLMKGLVQRAIKFIRTAFEKYNSLGYKFVVAFSGGKDSLVLLDLVQKALSPDEFYVVFGNTDMELSATIEAVENAKAYWPNLRFYEAASHLSANQSWDEFGPPGRRMRWCCAVHKSVPTVLLLRQLTDNNEVQAVVYDGVRAAESEQRSTYDEITKGGKNINQINCSPILKWNAAELYIYLLENKILFNNAYRYGLFRVGCSVCPMSSNWWDGIANIQYKDDMAKLLSNIKEYAKATKPEEEIKKYIDQGGWKGRMGGRGLKNGGNRVYETIENNVIKFAFISTKQDWLETARLLGPIVERSINTGEQLIDGKTFNFLIEKGEILTVTYSPYDKMNRFIISHLRGVANKVAYCIGCKACMVECPTSAFFIDENCKILIRENQCIYCSNCISFTGKGCLVAKSLATTQGGNGMDLKGMNRYQHFGLRKAWLEHFFDYKTNCFTKNELGNRQYDSLKVWLKEAELLQVSPQTGKNGTVTPLFEKLEKLGPYHPLTWAIIWSNLGYNSTIVKWYMLYVPSGEVYEKGELVYMLGDDYSESQRDNAVTALAELFRHSPIGDVLQQGIPLPAGNSFKFNKRGWETPDDVALLYSLYKWAEKTSRYNFTLSQMESARIEKSTNYVGIDPISMFALDPSKFKDMLQTLALQYDKYIRVSFVADLDNVTLFPELSSLNVLDLTL
jgi:phosphoadenosine phosphosulfate reductase